MAFPCPSKNGNVPQQSKHWPETETEMSCSDDESEGSLSTAAEDVIEAILKKFPVQIICLEALDETLDSIMEKLDIEEWRSCIFQIIMSLVIYRKMFDLTHNDLHTNNVMYKKTNIEYYITHSGWISSHVCRS